MIPDWNIARQHRLKRWLVGRSARASDWLNEDIPLPRYGLLLIIFVVLASMAFTLWGS